jgi:hypothetical protein
VAMNIGKRLWTSSDEMSMNIETNPSTQMPPGNLKSIPLAEVVDSGGFGFDRAMRAVCCI